MGKTRKKYKKNVKDNKKSGVKGGKVIASGGYGCVFNPVLKCEDSPHRNNNKISKLMTEKHAVQEYEEMSNIKQRLDFIPNYKDYYLLYDVSLCRPSKLTNTDLMHFKDRCTALPKDDITKSNINSKLEQVMSINMPNGGLPVDDYIYKNGSFQKMHVLYNKLIQLLTHGIVPMNKANVYHSDIKDSNVLVDEKDSSIKTRLIDWGLTVHYKPNDEKFPKNWRNRPLQFNVPFSVILFSDLFYEKYSNFLKENKENKEKESTLLLKPFVIDFLKAWMNERGAGHYKFINEIMFKLYSNSFSNITDANMPTYIETQITMPLIVDYIVAVLSNYTRFKQNGDLNLREYLDEVYIKIVDIYGYINVYYPLIELLHNNYSLLTNEKMDLFNELCDLYKQYLYSPTIRPYNMSHLLDKLKKISNLIKNVIENKTSNSLYDLEDNVIKKKTTKTRTKKQLKSSNTSLFQRKKLVKRFKNPIFLSLK